MAVSTDGILLGAWAKLTDDGSILDIGTGTGLLALMCAQRTETSHITAIDLDSEAITAARKNVEQSPWANRIEVHQADIQTYSSPHTFEHIVCNPPYFNSGETSNRQARAMARHTHSLSHQALLSTCQRLLNSCGCASFILPNAEGKAFIEMAQQQGWYVERLCFVNTTERKPAYRLLFTLVKNPCTTAQSHLTIHQNAGYSAEFIRLTRDFYLKM